MKKKMFNDYKNKKDRLGVPLFSIDIVDVILIALFVAFFGGILSALIF